MRAAGDGGRDRAMLRRAIELSRRCPPSETAFSVGAVVCDAGGRIIAEGYSRRDDPHDHAEEVALRALAPDDPRLADAVLYTSLEPCGRRASRPRPCAELILDTPIPRIVYAWREPVLFVDGDGAERLTAAGRTVVELPDLADEARSVNAHLLNRGG
ncbi:diaminohydroxyphosphoribosylaminopyrimidine deaminase/5-amino-6-(5-phosphoribosylamino)uracil reductase [Nocardiopsis composta]|uniref:Diaminohydroxyphosphoribosylaminopyrimidine deaminase/5-amino-6-(5-phosphoribosylamino)uracil reductase n=2 Tax=Nocardiopsis composta TaxID=157465 RepID=A0A7W8VDP2_9ACTN|nr:diaminohydroxyphosphoribosylaminopyrimidine deaminase/5-amino-6-(5-phosphoribosylamino)uracil reductase [Nocardiopsis composta]